MSEKTFTIVEWIATGVESIGIGVTLAIGGKYAPEVMIAIPIIKEAVIKVIKLFVKK